MVAVQGPASDEVMHAAGLGCATKLDYYHRHAGDLCGAPVIVSATVYTGEMGYEIYLPWNEVLPLWKKLISPPPHWVAVQWAWAHAILCVWASMPRTATVE